MQQVDREALEARGQLYWMSMPGAAKIKDKQEQLEVIDDRLDAMLEWCDKHKIAPVRANIEVALQIDDATLNRWEIGKRQTHSGAEIPYDTLSQDEREEYQYIATRRERLKKWIKLAEILTTQLACSTDKSNAGGIFLAKAGYRYNDRLAEQETDRGTIESLLDKAKQFRRRPDSGK